MTFELTSTAFADGETIPKKYTGEGDDISPQLSWIGLPDGTKELALICDDPDAPTPQPWVHWVIYKIPVDFDTLAQAVNTADTKLLEGLNSWPTIGYRGPMPPPGHGLHHYYFKLYALDEPLDVAAGLDKQGLLEAMKGHIIAQTQLIGTYQR